ncbi:MAG: NUDIX hydrolase [bacterium]|nr:MAG: NUDIX hydrolase [bacterium]
MKVEVKTVQRILNDYFKVDRAVLQFEKFDGTMSPEIVRLNFERGDSVAAIIYNTTSQKIVFVKQFRYPIFTKDKDNAWSLEIVAGIIEEGKSPEDTMTREVLEETGYRVHHLQPLFSFYPTPGGSNEKIFLFFAKVNQQDRIHQGGGLIEEGENIQLLEIPAKNAFKMLDSGKIFDAKTIIALQWLKSRQQLLE